LFQEEFEENWDDEDEERPVRTK